MPRVIDGLAFGYIVAVVLSCVQTAQNAVIVPEVVEICKVWMDMSAAVIVSQGKQENSALTGREQACAYHVNSAIETTRVCQNL